MIDFTLNKKQSTIVVCHTPAVMYLGTFEERSFKKGERYKLDVELNGRISPNRLWIWYDENSGCRFSINKEDEFLAVVSYTRHFYDIDIHREMEINEILNH